MSTVRAVGRLMDVVSRAVDVLATISFFGFFAAVVAQVAYRYLGISIVFSEELARLLNLYAVFLGAVVATRIDAHIRIDVIDHFVGRLPRLFAALRIVYLAGAIVFLCVFAIGASRLVVDNWDIPLASMDWLNNGHIYLSAAIGAWLMALISLGRIAEIALGIPGKPATVGEAAR